MHRRVRYGANRGPPALMYPSYSASTISQGTATPAMVRRAALTQPHQAQRPFRVVPLIVVAVVLVVMVAAYIWLVPFSQRSLPSGLL